MQIASDNCISKTASLPGIRNLSVLGYRLLAACTTVGPYNSIERYGAEWRLIICVSRPGLSLDFVVFVEGVLPVLNSTTATFARSRT